MCVIVPTRGRPGSVRRLIEAFAQTHATAALHLGFDDDDDTLDPDMVLAVAAEHGVNVRVLVSARTNMNGTLNALSLRAACEYEVIGFMGDDHCPRTEHWDERICTALRDRPAIAYGNDLFQGANLPTAVFMTSDIVTTLGYMGPPALKHLYLDNAWRDWGQGIRRYQYLPDVVIEHLHPQAGKAEWDEGHVRVNGAEMWEHDAEAYRVYCAKDERIDLEKLRALI